MVEVAGDISEEEEDIMEGIAGEIMEDIEGEIMEDIAEDIMEDIAGMFLVSCPCWELSS